MVGAVIANKLLVGNIRVPAQEYGEFDHSVSFYVNNINISAQEALGR